MNILLLVSLLLYILASVYVFLRSKMFTYRYKLIRIAIISVHALFLISFVAIALFFGGPHQNYKIFSFYFQLNFLFLLYFVFFLFLTTAYLFCDSFMFFIAKRLRQGTVILVRRIFHKSALVLTLLLWGFMLHGYFFGITNFTVREYSIHYENLPPSFNGVKILHFSDTHLGSFSNPKDVQKGVEIIQEQNADIIFFTGDLVNISSEEALPYVELFSSIKAPLGKYAVVGNHDMSDYMKIDISRDSVNVNLAEILSIMRDMGFVVLRDTAVVLQNETDKIQIAGTDYWGKPPFKVFSDPEKVFSNLDTDLFTILLTHDPSFWNSYVENQRNIELTLAGHTHGMQFGIRTKNYQWSPVSLKYKEWAGLYYNNENVLHVNPGFGFIGLPFRAGIYPEITVITLVN
jgi:uncharacterized protein